MIKITISVNNGKTVKVLPIIQEESLTIDYGQSTNENRGSIKHGQIKIIGAEPLASVTIDSFFPTNKYDFMVNDASIDALGYVKFFRDNRKNKRPFRIVITNEDKQIFNRLMALETFSINKIDRAGDIYYSMQFEQYRSVK